MALLAMLAVLVTLMLVSKETAEDTGGNAPKTSKVLESTVGAPAALCRPPALCCQLQCVLQPTGALQYVGVSRVVVALTAHLNATKSVSVVHISLTLPLYIHSIPAFVLTLDHLWDEGMAACRASDTLELRHGAGAPRCGVATLVQRQHLDVPQQHAAVIKTLDLPHQQKLQQNYDTAFHFLAACIRAPTVTV